MPQISAWHAPMPSSPVPTGSSLHFRLTVMNTGGAQLLGSLVSGGIPNWVRATAGPSIYPVAVSLALVPGQAGSPSVRVTQDGQTDPDIANNIGWLLAEEPGYTYFPCPDQLAMNALRGLRLLASADTTYVVANFTV